MTVYLIFFIILIALLVALGIWQVILLREIKGSSSGSNNLSEKSYYELKYQLQMLTAIFPTIIILLGFLGFKELTTIPETVNKEISNSVKPKIDSLNIAFELLSNKHSDLANDYNALLANYGLLKNREKGVRDGLATSTISLQQLQNQLNVINNKDIIQQNIYVVNDLQFKYRKMTEPEFYEYIPYQFSSLKTVSGQRLPKFKKPPIILPLNNTGEDYNICNVTTFGFKAWNAGGTSGEPCNNGETQETYKFNIIIFSQD